MKVLCGFWLFFLTVTWNKRTTVSIFWWKHNYSFPVFRLLYSRKSLFQWNLPLLCAIWGVSCPRGVTGQGEVVSNKEKGDLGWIQGKSYLWQEWQGTGTGTGCSDRRWRPIPADTQGQGMGLWAPGRAGGAPVYCGEWDQMAFKVPFHLSDSIILSLSLKCDWLRSLCQNWWTPTSPDLPGAIHICWDK